MLKYEKKKKKIFANDISNTGLASNTYKEFIKLNTQKANNPRYHLTPVRTAKINSGNNRCWWGCRKRRTLLHCWWESKLQNSMEAPQKIKNRTTLQPSNCTAKYLSKGYKNADSKGHTHPNVYSCIINNSQIMERAQMSTDCWIWKMRIYTYTQWSISQRWKRMKSWHLQQR